MADRTRKLELKYIVANQSQKEVTINEDLNLLDMLVQATAKGVLNTPPESPAEGEMYIISDAVQHAPHGVLNPEEIGVDAMNIAPYKFFGCRGFGLMYLSARIKEYPHHKLIGRAADDWEIGSPAT